LKHKFIIIINSLADSIGHKNISDNHICVCVWWNVRRDR
jgi:hypothetical protein